MPVDPKFDIETIMKKPIGELSVEELKLRLAAVEKKGAIQLKGKNLNDLKPDDLVEISVPFAPLGEVYKINEVPYTEGTHKVPLRVARQLASMISESFKIERERLTSRSNHMQGAMLRGEELAKIQRFEQIIRED